MDRAFAAGAVAYAPSIPGSPAIGYPTSGNPSSGVPATRPGAFWYYMMTEEIRNVIAKSGITPDYANLAQLAVALDTLYRGVRFADFGSTSGNLAFAITDLPKIIAVQANGQTLTLPPVSDANKGAMFRMFVYPGTSKSVTIQANASAQISTPTTLSSSIAVSAGGFTDFIWEGSSTNHWEVGGDGIRAYAPDFSAILATPGSQLLPSGFLLKWGAYNLGPLGTSASSSGNVVFPTAFPTACYFSALISGDKLLLTGTSGYSAAQISGNFINNFASSLNMAGNYIAIGK
jgi:hypothetical protein